MLEDGAFSNNDKNNQFLASVITSYPCLDMWVKPHGQTEIEVRLLYMQCDSSYVADPDQPWTRTGERPKVWQQFRGDWDEVRSQLFTALPNISRLSDEKRHGLSNFGSKQPFEGGGLIFSYDENSRELSVQGRFGALTVVNDEGVELPFNRLNFDFNCCDVEVTVTDIDWGNNGYIIDGGIGGGGSGRNPNRYEQETTPSGNMRLVIQSGYVSAVAASFVPINPPGFAAIQSEWKDGIALNVPLGTQSAVTAPTPDATYSYKFGAQWQESMNQAYNQVDLNCSRIEVSPGIYEGGLAVPILSYRCLTADVGLDKASYVGQTGTTGYHAAAGTNEGFVPGTMRVTKNGGSWSFQWSPLDPSNTQTGLSINSNISAPGNVFEGYQSNGGSGLLGVTSAYSSLTNTPANTKVITGGVACTIDTPGALNIPPPGATVPTYVVNAGSATGVDTINYSTWRVQLSCSLP